MTIIPKLLEVTEEGKRISKKRILNKIIQYGLPITMVAAVQNSAGLVDAIIVKGRLLAAGFFKSESRVIS